MDGRDPAEEELMKVSDADGWASFQTGQSRDLPSNATVNTLWGCIHRKSSFLSSTWIPREIPFSLVQLPLTHRQCLVVD